MSEQTTVEIGGREFRIGAWYAPRRKGRSAPKRIDGFRSHGHLPGGNVSIRTRRQVETGDMEILSGAYWSQWAGEIVMEKTDHIMTMQALIGSAGAGQMGGQAKRLAEEIERLRARIEGLGEMASCCVGRDLGRRCSYCRCDGRNLRGAD